MWTILAKGPARARACQTPVPHFCLPGVSGAFSWNPLNKCIPPIKSGLQRWRRQLGMVVSGGWKVLRWGMRTNFYNKRRTCEFTLCYAIVLPAGPEICFPGQILAGMLPGKNQNRSSGRQKAGRRADFGSFPVAVRPKSRPEGRFPARKHYCVT